MVIVITTRSALHEPTTRAALRATADGLPDGVNSVGIFRFDRQPARIGTCESLFVIDARPMPTAVIGTIEAGCGRRIDGCVDARALCHVRRGESDAAEKTRRPAMAGQLCPRHPLVGRFVDGAAAADVRHEITEPWKLMRL